MLEKSLSIEEICNQRLECIKETESQFDAKPNLNDAIVLRDLWTNWIEYKWGKPIPEKAPSEDYVTSQIQKYSSYVQLHSDN